MYKVFIKYHKVKMLNNDFYKVHVFTFNIKQTRSLLTSDQETF